MKLRTWLASALLATTSLLGIGCGVPEDLPRATELLERGCSLGSEYGCELKL